MESPCDPSCYQDATDTADPPVANKDDFTARALGVTLESVDRMKFEFFQTDAEVQRAKEMCRDVLSAIKPAIVDKLSTVGPVESVEPLIMPILSVMDSIKTPKLEASYRRQVNERARLPQLNVYPRELCAREQLTSAATSLKAKKKGTADVAVAWETRLEEVLESEFAF